MVKNGQITIFVILGILILAVIAISFFLLTTSKKMNQELDEQNAISLGNVQYYTQQCLEDAAEESVSYIAQHGGFDAFSNLTVEYNGENRPYYLYGNEVHIPEKETVETEFGNFVSKELIYCLARLAEQTKDYNINFRQPETSVEITDKAIDFEININIKITKGDAVKTLDSFKISLPTNFLILYTVAKEITLLQKDYQDIILRSKLIDLSAEHNLEIETISISKNEVVFVIIDKNNKIKKQPVEYVFVHKYTGFGNE